MKIKILFEMNNVYIFKILFVEIIIL